jgi:uncharacterized protein (TIGR03000 family)
MFRTRFALAMLVAVLASFVVADRAEAGWHHWGYGYYPYSAYVAVYRPVVVAPVCYSSCCRPILGHRCRWFGCCSYGYYAPSYSWYGNSCWSSGYTVFSPYYAADPSCCGSPMVDSYKSIVPSYEPEPAEAEMAPVLPPAPEEPVAPSVDSPPAPAKKAARSVTEPADAPPALPPDPDALLPSLPDAGVPQLPDPSSPAVPTPALPLLPDSSSMPNQLGDSAVLAVRVPADARVFVNGMLTKTPGTYRQYVSRGLVPGNDYTYEVRVEVTRGGRTFSNTRTVNLQANGTNELAFRMDQDFTPVASQTPAETSLTVRVPEAARVTLEGRSTEATGDVRTFMTRELRDGQRWEGYRVVVEVEQAGRVQTSVKTIDLVGGKSHELSFDFSPQVASR